ncbi:RNA polymerase sigma-54 factor [Anoxybacillus flavithermus]|uniref:RNA polymerase sigma-54 factor n=1 Tax=Anoxybacillus flavithermus TaxID=33934 RepID=A0A2G5RSK0_9BACL|nr:MULTISPECIES: RNA polymerase factor sigma-54 [Anoxybacillus]KFZ42167.1 RNA polymerase sigma54 factor [Anoxybacillus sp. KU2-6(11)]PIC05774.1 RNA polymerase sigma-54 factor [Anoxybacillus flavithermus]
MEMRLTQRQELKVALTKELVQAIELLQYSTLELQSLLHEQALENPFIELRERKRTANKRRERTDQKHYIENVSAFNRSLASHLHAQLIGMRVSEEERKALDYLIASLDEYGYLHTTVAEAACHLQIEETIVSRALHMLRSLDPAGVGAENLSHCLYLQLIRLPQRDELAETIVTEYFEPFVNKKWKEIKAKLGVELADLQRVWELIRTLHPRPGSLYNDEQMTYIVPDVIVSYSNGAWSVTINEGIIPTIVWNELYERKVQTDDPHVQKYIEEKRQQFYWIQRCLTQRAATIEQIACELIDRQRDYFEKGLLHMKPLTMRDVAASLNMHESTVSRAVKNKYMQTPHGLIDMRRFFTSGVDDASQEKVKSLIAELVRQENSQKPLSDQNIADLLEQRYNICVARRTVAKYREQLHIPPASKRKQYA